MFVCTGNTCRSAIAEAIGAREAATRRRPDILMSSAGTSAWDGAPASDGALLVGIERQLDLSAHRSRQLSRDLVSQCDLILGMGPHHVERVEALGGAGKAYLLTDYAGRTTEGLPIVDPFGGGLDIYRSTTDEIDREVRRMFDRITVEWPAPSGAS